MTRIALASAVEEAAGRDPVLANLVSRVGVIKHRPRNKLASLRDLSVKVLDGTVDFARFARQSDDAIVDRLIGVRGIGRWTAEMFLMFEFRRLDVWPVDDLGVRQGHGLAWGIDPPPTPKPLLALGEPFRPYRSILARYCWEAVALSRAGTDPSLR